jgi:2-dehydro-3-deoxy-D-gluconate 5-dehydrogenase
MNSREYLHSLFGLSGRRAVVTGASSGLGAEMAKILASAGASVLAVARRPERLTQLARDCDGMDGRVVVHQADLRDEAEVVSVGDAVEAKLGGCDIVVANAGTIERVPLAESHRDQFAKVLDLNVTSQWLLSRVLFPYVKASAAGRVINMASIMALGAYSVSKHALLGLTRSQAVEWAPHGITANAIAPGYFPTEMTQAALENPEVAEHLLRFSPMGRFGRPSELAPALLFLASPASSYVTGTIIPVDGGWTAW